MEGYNEITGLEGNKKDGLPQFVCRSCARKIVVNSKQRANHSESGNTRIKREKKLKETPPGPTVSPPPLQ